MSARAALAVGGEPLLKSALARLVALSSDDRDWLLAQLTPASRARLFAALQDHVSPALAMPTSEAHARVAPVLAEPQLHVLARLLPLEPDWVVAGVLARLDLGQRETLRRAAPRPEAERWARLERASTPFVSVAIAEATWRSVQRQLEEGVESAAHGSASTEDSRPTRQAPIAPPAHGAVVGEWLNEARGKARRMWARVSMGAMRSVR